MFLDELPDKLGNLLQGAPLLVVAALPAVGGVELAAGALGGFGGGGFGGAVIGQLEGGENRVILGVDGLMVVSSPPRSGWLAIAKRRYSFFSSSRVVQVVKYFMV